VTNRCAAPEKCQQDGFVLFQQKEALMRSAHSSTLTLSRIAACTLTALALLSACGKKDDAQAGAGGAGGKMPPRKSA
jgi:hypothetical protein